MRTRVLALLLAAASVGGSIGVAQADPGPHHGNNAHGLCTAYFNGQKNGHGDGENQPRPFAALQQTAEDEHPRNQDDDEGNDVTGFEAIYDWCTSATNIGGSPEHGRFTCTDDVDIANEDETNCTENTDGPGNSEGSNGRGNR